MSQETIPPNVENVSLEESLPDGAEIERAYKEKIAELTEEGKFDFLLAADRFSEYLKYRGVLRDDRSSFTDGQLRKYLPKFRCFVGNNPESTLKLGGNFSLREINSLIKAAGDFINNDWLQWKLYKK